MARQARQTARSLRRQPLDGGRRRRWAGVAEGARPRSATIWLHERTVGIMLTRTNVSTRTGTVATFFPSRTALTPTYVPKSDSGGGAQRVNGRAALPEQELIVWGWPGGGRARTLQYALE
ncbi:hypothetical protein B0H14DRAFT_2581044 [Mycena olivaceomarginata]|nr:hypothetical protein B0H14DRAFT_2581044 [Mycena olivaceomarginata]